MKKIYVAYNGIEDIHQRNKKHFRIKFKHPILYAGIADPLQNIELVITSLPLIKEVFPNTNLVLTGRYKKNYFNKLMTLAKSLNIKSSIHHLGLLPEESLPDVYKQSDIIISVPSDYVGWSAILLKGILYKKPCIALNKGALKEFIQRYDGIYVPNNPKDFSDAVITLLKNNHLRKKIIETAYKRAKKDMWEKTAMVHFKCIKDIMRF